MSQDVVLMAQALEKQFLTKVAQMPQEEIEIPPPSKDSEVPGKRGKKGNAVAAAVAQLTANATPATTTTPPPPPPPSVTALPISTSQPPPTTQPQVPMPLPDIPPQLSIPEYRPQQVPQPPANSVVQPPAQPVSKAKKGVKRKADTTTPTALILPPSHEEPMVMITLLK